MPCVAAFLPAPVELERRNYRVRHLRAGRRKERLQLRDAHASGDAQLRSERKLQQRRNRRPHVVRPWNVRSRGERRQGGGTPVMVEPGPLEARAEAARSEPPRFEAY